MGLSSLLAIALTTTAFVDGQYGPIKGPSARRTTTPFPPGFQSDNDLYNAEPNSISPLPNQASGSYSYKDNSASLSGSFSSTSSNAPDNSWWSNNPAPLNNAPSGYGSAPTSSQKTPAGAFAQPDNPWLSGIIAQNSQPKPAAKRPGSCGYGGCGSSIPQQQTRPTIPCTTPGFVCVQKFQCQNGQTYSTGTGAGQCDLNTEVCCQQTESRPLPVQPQPTYQPRPQPLPTFQPPRPQPQPQPQPQPAYQPPPPPQPQPSYPQPTYRPPPPQPKPQPQLGYPQPQSYQQPQPQPQPSYPQPTNNPPPPTPRPSASYPQPSYTPGNNGIPIGGSIYDSSANRPVAQRPSNYVTPPPFQPYTGPLNTTPHPGCAAALKCVEEIYCTADGVMSDSPVYLTREQAENKVPLSECQNIETGIIGKCCRDPNYKDPWPAGMMMNGPSHFDDGQYHEPTHQHQGTPNVNCGPSATCTPQYQCPGERQTQPGKACQVPQDGSTGVCCNRPLFPPGSNNQQFNTAPSNVYPTTSALTTPAQQYYTPKPSLANNPFLTGKLPAPQKRPAPGYPAPTSYTAQQPNAITEQKRYPEYGKSSTPVPIPDIDVRSRPSRPLRPAPGYPQPIAQASTLAPEVTNLTPQSSNLPSQQYLPQSYSRPLPDSNKRTDEPVPSSTITVITLGTEESNDITPAPTPKQEEITPLTSPESEAPILIPSSRPKVRGPAPGYPFLAPTTEAPSIVRSTAAPLPLSTPEPGKECGVRRGVPRPNGPAGLETGFGEFPWQAQVVSSTDQNPLCGGAILSDKIVVTAAHCINNLQSKDIMVKAGDWKLATENPAEEPKPVQIRFVAAIAKHPKYDPISQFNDMAVLVLEEPLKLDTHVDTLCLGEDLPPGQKPRGSNCVVTGWGKANLQGNVPGSTMHSIPVNFIQNEQCEKAFQNTYLGKYFQLHRSFTCALPVTPNHDLCQVDVGSPIACQKPDGRYELSGIYSWDVGCHPNTNIPAAASTVDKKWVQEVMEKPVEQVKREEREEIAKKENLGQLPVEGSETKPGFSQGYGK